MDVASPGSGAAIDWSVVTGVLLLSVISAGVVCATADMSSPETQSAGRVRKIKVFILIPVLFVA
jgi:hypothetical protein